MSIFNRLESGVLKKGCRQCMRAYTGRSLEAVAVDVRARLIVAQTGDSEWDLFCSHLLDTSLWTAFKRNRSSKYDASLMPIIKIFSFGP